MHRTLFPSAVAKHLRLRQTLSSGRPLRFCGNTTTRRSASAATRPRTSAERRRRVVSLPTRRKNSAVAVTSLTNGHLRSTTAWLWHSPDANARVPRLRLPPPSLARNFSAVATTQEDDEEEDEQNKFSSALASRSPSHTGPLWESYYSLLQKSDVHADPHQIVALESLERLRQELLTYQPPANDSNSPPAASSTLSSSSSSSSSSLTSSFGSWFSLGATSGPLTSATASNATSASHTSLHKAPRGVYLHGGVGCGKTFCMNLFYDSIAGEHPWAHQKQKIHFHKFMLQVHQAMHMARKDNATNTAGRQESDAILPAVIADTVRQGRLICLDEFQVTDVADALILQRLFTGLWENGCVVVATSNRPPEDLYLNGLQRDRFLPFIDLLNQQCQVISMWDSQIDYRLIQKMQSGTVPVFFVGSQGRPEFDELFYELVGTGRSVLPTSLRTQGRKVKIPLASLSRGVARFSFEDLCQKALGAADYLVIGQHFHTVFVENIPILGLNELNWVRRFIIFVDSMYESNVKLILHASTSAHEIFQPDTKTDHEEVFAFDRTLSRLDEMASESYLRKRWSAKAMESKAELLSKQKATLSMTAS